MSCTALTKDSRKCMLPCMKGTKWCVHHNPDPKHRKKMMAAAKKAGKSAARTKRAPGGYWNRKQSTSKRRIPPRTQNTTNSAAETFANALRDIVRLTVRQELVELLTQGGGA